MTSLEAADVAPEDVTHIFISHSRFDHVGGLAKDGALVFPNATIHMSAPEWEFMQANEQQAAIVSAISDRVETFEPGAELIPGLLTAVETQGHTPGHSSYRVTSGEESLLYIGDTMHHFVISVEHPGWKSHSIPMNRQHVPNVRPFSQSWLRAGRAFTPITSRSPVLVTSKPQATASFISKIKRI